jgi:hypothetical protein
LQRADQCLASIDFVRIRFREQQHDARGHQGRAHANADVSAETSVAVLVDLVLGIAPAEQDKPPSKSTYIPWAEC